MIQNLTKFIKHLFHITKRKIGTYVLNRLTANPIITFGWIVIVLTCGLIIANAVTLQSGPHPAPLFRDSQKIAEIDDEAFQIKGKELPKDPVRTLIEDVQFALSQIGFYEGDIDGRIGPLTKQAILNFQEANNIPADPMVTQGLLAKIMLYNPEIKVAKIDHINETRISTLQEALANLGFGPVKIDGQLSQETKEAIEKFEQNRGLPVTGEPSETVLNELRNIGGLTN